MAEAPVAGARIRVGVYGEGAHRDALDLHVRLLPVRVRVGDETGPPGNARGFCGSAAQKLSNLGAWYQPPLFGAGHPGRDGGLCFRSGRGSRCLSHGGDAPSLSIFGLQSGNWRAGRCPGEEAAAARIGPRRVALPVRRAPRIRALDWAVPNVPARRDAMNPGVRGGHGGAGALRAGDAAYGTDRAPRGEEGMARRMSERVVALAGDPGRPTMPSLRRRRRRREIGCRGTDERRTRRHGSERSPPAPEHRGGNSAWAIRGPSPPAAPGLCSHQPPGRSAGGRRKSVTSRVRTRAGSREESGESG